MSEIKNPSEKLNYNFQGKEIIDSLGRIIKLRDPDALDEFDLMSALGNDASNPSCMNMAYAMLFINSIDGDKFDPPKKYSDIRAAIKRIGNQGFKALTDFINEIKNYQDQKEVIAEIKK